MTIGDKHQEYMKLALSCAQKSPPKPTNFRVGAVLVDEETDTILSTGYTLELPGNTHAEQCCLTKLTASEQNQQDINTKIMDSLPPQSVIYTTLEPCSKRLSGNLPCVDRILETRNGRQGGIKKVYVGVYEPKNFVNDNDGRQRLEAAGIEFIHISGFEDEILKTATEGHVVTSSTTSTNI